MEHKIWNPRWECATREEKNEIQLEKMCIRDRVKDVQLTTDGLPKEINVKGYEGKDVYKRQVLAETCLMLQYAKPAKSCVFRSNHASNYVSLRGNLPEDNERMIASLKRCMEDRGMLKDERFRML